MSDLHPLSSLPPVSDPTCTQVFVRSIAASSDFRVLGAQATSCSIIVVADTPGDPGVDQCDEVENPIIAQVIAERDGMFSRVRPEVLIVSRTAEAGVGSRRAIRGRQPFRLRFHVAPEDCYCSALVEGVDNAANEFIVVPRFGSEPLVGLSETLGHMWMDGADMAVIPADSRDGVTGENSNDPVSMLPRWLGLDDCRHSSATVVMRRWFAKWIFNEADRLPNPVEELADRIRLLGSTVLVMEQAEG